MKKILKLPLRRIPRRPPPAEPLRAKAAADAGTYDNEDYETEEEPNMKFSHALIVVLALHIIAVGGVFAFNSIKAGQSASAKAESAPATAHASTQPKPNPAQQTVEGRVGKTHTVQAGDTLGRIASLYKVSVEAIEKGNGITTYSMIRVGQVLRIPASESSAKPEVARTAADSAAATAKHAFLAAKTDIAKPAAVLAKTETTKSPTILAKTDTAKAPATVAKTDAAKPSAAAAASPKPASAQPSPKKPEAAAPTANSDVYVVAKGDNPYNIAKKLHVSYSDLIAINEIKDPTRVQVGQKLKIPAKKN